MNLYRDLGNSHGMGICHNNIGNIHLKNFRYNEAIESYIQAVSIINEERNVFLITNNRKASEKEIFVNERYRRYTKIWANRVFQLAEAKLEQITHCVAENHIKDHIKQLDEIIDLYASARNTFVNLGGLGISKTITISIKTSFAYLLEEEFEKAQEMINEAEILYNTFEKRGFENLDVPESVLKQKILVQKGLLWKRRMKFRQAVECFTLSLENCELYDPKTKKEYIL